MLICPLCKKEIKNIGNHSDCTGPVKTEEAYTVILYEIEIINSLGAHDVVNENYKTIREYYIPYFGISFNKVDQIINIFKTELTRYNRKPAKKIKEFVVNQDFVYLLIEYLNLKNVANEQISKLMKVYS
jgi:hypothetical protein